MLFLLYSRNTVRAKASLVQREVAKPEVLPEGLYSKRDCFFSGLPVKMQNLIVSNPSVSFADRSLYTRKQRAWADSVVRPYGCGGNREHGRTESSAPTGAMQISRRMRNTLPFVSQSIPSGSCAATSFIGRAVTIQAARSSMRKGDLRVVAAVLNSGAHRHAEAECTPRPSASFCLLFLARQKK